MSEYETRFTDGNMTYGVLAENILAGSETAQKYVMELPKSDLFNFITYVEGGQSGEAVLKTLFEISLALAYKIHGDKK